MMRRTKKNYINIGIIIFASILALGGIAEGIAAIGHWYEKIPHDFLLLDDTTKNANYSDKYFPSEKPIAYSMKNVPQIVDTKEYFFYGKINKDDNKYQFVLAKKTGKEYTMLTGEDEGYSFKDPTFFHLAGPFQFKKGDNTVHIRFLNKDQYKNFIQDVEDAEKFRQVFYYKNNQSK